MKYLKDRMRIIVFLFFWTYISGWYSPGSAQITGQTGFVQVSTTNPRYFQLSGGETYIPLGPNICFPRFVETEAEGLAKMEQYFRKLAENKGNYTRVWLSSPFLEVEHQAAGSYDNQKAARIEAILTMAQKYNIKVKFCLEHFRTLQNYPAKFPGSVPFDRPVYHVSNGGPLQDMEAYFTTGAGKELFLKRAQFLSTTFGNNPHVFGWELWNEINAVKAGSWLPWTTFMLDTLQHLFPRHLVMQSLGSFDNEQVKHLYKKVLGLEKNDVAQIHRYLDPGANLPICQAPMALLARDATQEMLGYELAKPMVVSEIGAVEANHAGPSALYESDTVGHLLHDLLFAPFFSGAAGPGQSWHWDFYIDKNNLWYHYARFAEAIKEFDPVKENARPFAIDHPQLWIWGLQGKTRSLLWCRDKNNTWKNEFQKGIAPEELKQVQIPLKNVKSRSINLYDPWKNTWTTRENPGKSMVLPAFSRSLVIQINH
jgi:hypothetical protein